MSSADEEALSLVPASNYMAESLSPKQLMNQPGSNSINCHSPFVTDTAPMQREGKLLCFITLSALITWMERCGLGFCGPLQTSYNKKYVNVLPNIKPCQSLINGVRQREAAGHNPDDDDANPSFHHGHAWLERVHDYLQRTMSPEDLQHLCHSLSPMLHVTCSSSSTSLQC